MSNVSYQVEGIKDGIVTVLETFDLTEASGPGFLMRYGKVVDCASEGIVSATKRIRMSEEQAVQLGIPLLPHKLRETIDRLDAALTSA